MNVCVDVYLKNCWLLMLTNEYEYNEFGTKAFYEKLKCLLTDVISYFVVFTYQDGNLVAQLVALFKFVAQMLAFVVFCCIFRRCHSKLFWSWSVVCSYFYLLCCCSSFLLRFFFNVWDGYIWDLHQQIIVYNFYIS